MQAVIEYIEVKSIEYTEDLPKVEMVARVILPQGKIKSIDKARIAEGVRCACINAVELDRGTLK